MDTTTERAGHEPAGPAPDADAPDPRGVAIDAAGADAPPAVEVTADDAPAHPGATDSPSPETRSDPEHDGDVAADYLEEFLDIADLDGDIDLDVEGDRAMVSLEGGDVAHLVGPDGAVVEALQELTRLAVLRETGHRSRLLLDVAGWRAGRREQVRVQAVAAAETVRSTGAPVPLPAMAAFERKVVHDVVAGLGLTSSSEGEDPGRHVVVRPA